MRSEEMYKQAVRGWDERQNACVQKEQRHTQNSDVTKDWTGSDVCEHSAGWGQEGSLEISGTATL